MNNLYHALVERPFNYASAKHYVDTIQLYTFAISIVYIIVIFAIKSFMSHRQPYKLETPLNIWNGALAIFSIGGTLVTTPALFREINEHGLSASYCHVGDFFVGTSGYWTFLFVLSKVAELGDTAFLVLRKRPLMFLHWYHHVLTLNYGILSYANNTAFNSWIVWLNFSVHAVMYSYYLLRSFHIRVPPSIAQCITLLQIAQFIITHLILFHIAYLYMQGIQCDVIGRIYWFCLIMEASYLALFANFFYHSYIRGGGKKFVADKMSKIE